MNILCLSCTDQPGLVAAVATCLAENDCNIEESAQFHDPASSRFFMRLVFSELAHGKAQQFEKAFATIAKAFRMDYQIHDAHKPVKTLLMVSTADHCLNDILYRWRTGTLAIDPVAVVSNHPNMKELSTQHKIPFHHLPVTPQNKPQQERQLIDLIYQYEIELIVLARYMQVLSDDLCSKFSGRLINIHHSFLPGFKGARPYTQAYECGVKIIGATAHFATADLDEGPIITQNVQPVSHRDVPDQMQQTGRDIESRTLAEALRLYTQRRIFLQGRRTIIL